MHPKTSSHGSLSWQVLAGLGVWLAGAFLPCAARWTEAGRRQTWGVLAGLANIALAAAAFLRWFS